MTDLRGMTPEELELELGRCQHRFEEVERLAEKKQEEANGLKGKAGEHHADLRLVVAEIERRKVERGLAQDV